MPVPSGVKVSVSGRSVTVTGPKGTSTWTCPESATVAFDAGSSLVKVGRTNDTNQARANHGLTRALIANMVRGVADGFQKRLLIYGTGYNCKLAGKTLQLNVGFSGRRHGRGAQFELPVPQGVEVVVERDAAKGDNEPASMIVRGFDKQKVGQFAAEIRSIRKTEPYKGKGIRYEGEYVRRKQGKALTGAAGGG